MKTPEQIVADLQRSLPAMKANATRVMHEAVDITQRREAELAPGSIGERINTTVRERAGGVTGTVRPRDAKAGFVDKGTGLYVEHHARITPKQPGKMLRFVGQDGQIMFRRSVKGQKPQRFVQRARDEVAMEVEALLTSGAEHANKELF